MNKKIVISIICYDNENEIIEYASQLEKQTYINNLVLLVTCNSCKMPNELIRLLNELSLETHVYIPESNIGYLAGCLFGIEQYSKMNKFDWGIISNTDMTFLDDSFLEKMFISYEDENILCLAPNIVRKGNGRNQNPFLVDRPSKVRINLWRIAYSNMMMYKIYFCMSRIKRTLRNKEVKDTKADRIYAPHGSFLVLKRECICELINEQADIFMFGEEILVGEILREKGTECYYLDKLKIMHNENETTKYVNDIKKQKWSKESIEYLYNRFYR